MSNGAQNHLLKSDGRNPSTIYPVLMLCKKALTLLKFQTQAELQRARLAISRMLSMPPVYSKMQNANVSECIRDRSELDMLAKMIDRFLIKLRNSVRKSSTFLSMLLSIIFRNHSRKMLIKMPAVTPATA
ncbi:hypothetical protein NECAME_11657 [Necator americanus]|uniref:Uncharacterized protein n=1 Tax=Necator americanus TaxID=51031 RepID=W2T656_NECAM|nr:hypothetical protein NECAME_11657 [Necator americanus]ETN76457.1 hypothetical protein NECAME_11657 [Necator americanus]